MEYYSSSYYNPDLGEYHQTPYYSSSDYFLSQPPQFSADQSSFSYADYDYYDQTFPNYAAFEPDYLPETTTVGYSVSSFTEPNIYFALDPAQTRFIVSYSVSEPNEDLDFEEYDPTPYGGGYNPIDTYGKPLPPSKETCYPHSSIVPQKKKTVTFAEPLTENPEIDESVAKDEDESKIALPIDVSGEKTGDLGMEQDDRVPGNPGNRVREIPEIENMGGRIPYGYGLEAMDLCESLFGYWPCLAKAKRQYEGGYGEGGRVEEEWRGTAADYLFGGSDPYGEGWDVGGSYQSVMYGYERHYQEQEECVYREVEYER